MSQDALRTIWGRFAPERQAQLLAKIGAASFEALAAKHDAEALGKRMLTLQGAADPAAAWAAECSHASAVPSHAGSYSARALDMALACPRRYALHYIHGEPHLEPGKAAEAGAAIHEQIAALLRGEQLDAHPAALRALAWVRAEGLEVLEVEAWRDNGILCGRIDLTARDTRRRGEIVVVDWKTCEEIELDREDGLQPAVYTALTGAARVVMVQIQNDGLDLWATQGAIDRGALGRALLLAEAYTVTRPALGACATPSEPGYASACVQWGKDCPALDRCRTNEGARLEADLRVLWESIAPERREKILATAGFATIDELVSAAGPKAGDAIAALAAPAPELPKPAKVLAAPAPTVAAEGPTVCVLCDEALATHGQLCAHCAGKDAAPAPKKRGRPPKAQPPPLEIASVGGPECVHCGKGAGLDRLGWATPVCADCVTAKAHEMTAAAVARASAPSVPHDAPAPTPPPPPLDELGAALAELDAALAAHPMALAWALERGDWQGALAMAKGRAPLETVRAFVAAKAPLDILAALRGLLA